MLLPKDYIRFRLTGHHVSEMSDAAGTLWLDVAARDWSDDLLEATGLTRAHMPRLVEGSAASGELLPDLAAPLGHRRRRSSSPAAPATTPPPPAASAWSRPGTAFVSIGTSGVLFVSNARFSPNTDGRGARLLPRHPRHLAPDGRDPLRLRQPRMARRASPAASPPTSPRAVGPVDGAVRRHLPALPLRRAHAAQRRGAPAAPSSASPSRTGPPT